jgi:hypothetical protein
MVTVAFFTPALDGVKVIWNVVLPPAATGDVGKR